MKLAISVRENPKSFYVTQAKNSLMKDEEYLLASVLHDIGVLWKTTGSTESHSELGAAFIKKYFPNYSAAAEAIKNHHNPLNDYEKKIAIADNLSLITKESEGINQLISPFSKITLRGEEANSLRVLPTERLTLERNSIFPPEEFSPNYETLKVKFCAEVEKLPKNNFFAMFNSLVYLLQKYTWCIPSPSDRDTVISLFDHLKTTCAIASCLRVDPDKFMLIGGDISGVQDFIYTITSKGATKGLKGRSFFLDLLNDAIARFILYNLELPITNLLYCGGGNFVILAPASKEQELYNIRGDILNALFEFSKGDLYLALETKSFDKSRLETPDRFQQVWKGLKEKLGQSKKKKFVEIMTEDNFSDLFGPFGEGGISEFCEVCKNESDILIRDEEGHMKCPLCDSFETLTKKLLTAEYLVEAYKQKEKKGTEAYEKIFDDLGFKFYFAPSLDEIVDIEAEKVVVYKIQDTKFLFEEKPDYAKGFRFMPNVIPHKEENHEIQIKSIDDLVKESKGIKKVAVLRADVDNLGMILSAGLPVFNLAVLSSVSQLLTLFFQGYLPRYIDEKYPNLMYVVYSGGDDCFIIGPWNLIFDLASEIRAEFTEFTCSNKDITLSMGISLIHHRFPVYKAAKMAGDALDKSKNQGKNRITVFDTDFQWDTEFLRVKNLEEKIVGVLKKKVSRALLYRISEVFADFDQFKKEIEKGNMATHRIWKLFYIISKFAKRHKNAERELSEIRDEYVDVVWKSIKWEENKVENKPEIMPVALRWAEFVTRGEKNERNN